MWMSQRIGTAKSLLSQRAKWRVQRVLLITQNYHLIIFHFILTVKSIQQWIPDKLSILISKHFHLTKYEETEGNKIIKPYIHITGRETCSRDGCPLRAHG